MSNRIAGHASASATEWIYRMVRAHERIMAKAKATSRTQRPRASGMNGRTAHVRVSTRAEHGRGKRKELSDVCASSYRKAQAGQGWCKQGRATAGYALIARYSDHPDDSRALLEPKPVPIFPLTRK